MAAPLPDPTIPAPDEFHVAYDAASDTMTVTWNTPDDLSEDAVSYLVYINGESSTYTPHPLTVLTPPDAPTLQMPASHGLVERVRPGLYQRL